MYKFCFLQSKMILVISSLGRFATEALKHRNFFYAYVKVAQRYTSTSE